MQFSLNLLDIETSTVQLLLEKDLVLTHYFFTFASSFQLTLNIRQSLNSGSLLSNLVSQNRNLLLLFLDHGILLINLVLESDAKVLLLSDEGLLISLHSLVEQTELQLKLHSLLLIFRSHLLLPRFEITLHL